MFGSGRVDFVKKHNMKQTNSSYKVSMKNIVGQHVFLLYRKTQTCFLESLIDIIASIKLIILQRYDQDNQLNSSSFETSLDQLIANKYSTCFFFFLS